MPLGDPPGVPALLPSVVPGRESRSFGVGVRLEKMVGSESVLKGFLSSLSQVWGGQLPQKSPGVLELCLGTLKVYHKFNLITYGLLIFFFFFIFFLVRVISNVVVSFFQHQGRN